MRTTPVMRHRRMIPTAAKRNRRKTAANRLSEIPNPREKMIPSPVTPSPELPPSDLRAGRSSFPPSSGSRGPPEMAGPFFYPRQEAQSMHSPAADIARRLAEDAEAVCRHYLTNGRKQGRYWIVGDVQNTPGRSLYVRLSGPTSGPGAAGKWTDSATGQHGDLLDLIALNMGITTLRDTPDEASPGCAISTVSGFTRTASTGARITR